MEALLVLLGVGVLSGGVLLWEHVLCPDAVDRRRLRKAPRTNLESVSEGQQVVVVGKLRYDDEQPILHAPLSQRPCCYYEVLLEERKDENTWTKLVEDSDSATTFWIEDGTGRALVKMLMSNVILNMDEHHQSGFLQDPTPELQAFLAKHWVSGKGWLFNKPLRYSEGVLEEGETVVVRGQGRWEPDPDPRTGGDGGYREPAKRLCIVPSGSGEMLISDDPRTLKR